jgi:hypothetical protein
VAQKTNKRQVYCKEQIQIPKSRFLAMSSVLLSLHLKDKIVIKEDKSKEIMLKDNLLSV